ncbi:serine/threonine-protein kinase SCDLUD_003526 [Saccharomycodes ludwigii]|uniref:serine/threonine-protein kinase n=1 Tax=Saccharomycodes ludwigii TaxID=36035 RepID=UPI001E885600|nr:hypothetical protein SCDLUD_003526 [Saccharomycodes ludwigii]KAH3900539.1 hypothetical protein SCDLUD_003526 [Saccharomycodes ludwigii]
MFENHTSKHTLLNKEEDPQHQQTDYKPEEDSDNNKVDRKVHKHTISKFLNKLHGQPESYLKKQDYIFGKTLGAGTFGVVRQAKKLSTNENVAVKILVKNALNGNKVQLQMLYDELEILQKVNHPNIVHFKDWFESKDKFYIVTQLAIGGELFDRILKRGKFTEIDAVEIVKQILSAIQYLHSINIVHRDLKPENLLYVDKTPHSQLVLADFGIAKELKNDDDLIFKAAGSMGYVAPEVLCKSGHGKPCDIWSIGVITYTLLCGYSPFVADDANGFMEEITAGPIPVVFHSPYWDDISAEAKNFILECCIIDLHRRPTASQLLKDKWLTCCGCCTDLLPCIKKEFNARKKLLKAIQVVMLNNRIKKLKEQYGMLDEDEQEGDTTHSVTSGNSNTSIDSTTTSPNSCSSGTTERDNNENTISSLNALRKTLEDLRLKNDESSQKLRSEINRTAFAQLVEAATRQKEDVLNYKEEEK